MRAIPSIFKSYDIRGKVPEELDADAAEQVGRAFVAYLKPKQVIVGRDVRLTGQEFQGRVADGVTKGGADVLDIGIVSTDAFYYACATRKLPGIMVTASHNPSEYNGFKMVEAIPKLVAGDVFRPYVLEHEYEDAETPGKLINTPIIAEFIEYLLDVVPAANLKPLKVVIDTSSGAQGPIWEELAPHLPIEVVPLSFAPDGNFPDHGNDVIQPANQQKLKDKVKEVGADMGLIFDPDGDRCLLVDDRGETVPGDFITALLAVSMLKRQPGSAIIYDIRASDAVPDMVREAGGKPVVSRVGHTHIKPRMQENDAVFGGEVSGHYYFKDFWFVDCGLLAGLVIIEYVSGLAGKLSEAVVPLEAQYNLSGEINSKVEDVPTVLKRLEERYSDAEFDRMDGLAVRYPDWHFVVRPSNTEPLIRLTLEAKTAGMMTTKRDEVLAVIRQEG